MNSSFSSKRSESSESEQKITETITSNEFRRPSFQPRKSLREVITKEIREAPVVKEIGDMVHRKSRYRYKTIIRSTSRKNTIGKKGKIANLCRVINKASRVLLRKGMAGFIKQWLETKGSSDKNFSKMSEFNTKLFIEKDINFGSRDSSYRLSSFEDRDKEIWSRRNSKSPITSEPASPKHHEGVFLIERNHRLRRRTAEPMKRTMTFGENSHTKKSKITKKFVEKMNFVNHITLKNKLLSFLAIIEGFESPARKINSKAAEKKGLQNIFRIFEAKIFSKQYHGIYLIKRTANHIFQKRVRIAKKFCQKFGKAINDSIVKNKRFVMERISGGHKRLYSLKNLFKALKNFKSRLKNLYKAHGFYRIKTYAEELSLKKMLRYIKIEHVIKKIYIRSLARSFV